MVQRHDSTPTQRAQAVCQMIAHAGDYGLVTHLSRDLGVSRQTLYRWLERGWQALEAAFLPLPAPPTITPALERQVLTRYCCNGVGSDARPSETGGNIARP